MKFPIVPGIPFYINDENIFFTWNEKVSLNHILYRVSGLNIHENLP